MSSRIKKTAGFTVIELMIVLVVLGILAGLAAPAFQSMLQNNKSAALSEDFVSAVNFARVEAVKRASSVSLCRTTDGGTCAVAGDWATGFLIYVEGSAETSTSTTIATDGLLKVYPAVDIKGGKIAVTRSGNPVSFIRFTGLGGLARDINADAIITTQFNKCKGLYKRVSTVKLSGSVTTVRQACS